MSFTTDVKQECANLDLAPCCKRSQLSAFLKLCATLSISEGKMALVIRSENPTIAKRILKLLKEQYQVESQLSVMKKMKLKKNNIYVIRIFNEVRHILQDAMLMDDGGLKQVPANAIVKKDCCVKAYLAGCFMASGSVNAPNKPNYHLEVSANEEAQAVFMQRLMNKYHLHAKIIKRRNLYVVYVKAADKISDFLNLIGAHSHLRQYEDIRIERDFMNSLKRLENCEVANEVKTQAAAKDQIDHILLIRKRLGFTMLDEKLKKVAVLRLDYPEASLQELCSVYEAEYDEVISKSGMKHRLSKMKELAKRITNNNPDE